MTDIKTPQARSFNMSRIKGKNTKPEMIVRKFLWSKGLRYRLHDKRLPGHPDLVFPKFRTVVFVNGCFWHMHKDCKYSTIPKTNKEFWIKKLVGNSERDCIVYRELRMAGWNVIVLWECETKGGEINARLEALYEQIITYH